MSNDGEKLKQLLVDCRKSADEFAAAVGKSRAMAYKYFSMKRFTPNTLELLLPALEKMKVPSDVFMSRDAGQVADAAELRSLLDAFSSASLPALRRILSITDRTTRIALEALIDDRLDRKR